MIIITDAMRATKRNQLRELETETDKRILKAVETGSNKAVFPLDYTDSLLVNLEIITIL